MDSGIKFKFSKPVFSFQIPFSFKKALSIEKPPLPSEWVDKHINLVPGAYTNKSKAHMLKWQIEPLDSIKDFPKIIILGPVQSGKSFIADMAMFYAMDIMKIEGMVIYCNEKTSKKMFKRRVKPMILGNDVLKQHWSGKDDDLSIENIQLKHSFWGVASSQNRNDIATFPAGFIIWSEVSKAENRGFDIFLEIRGRQEAYPLYRRKIILESSPNLVGDPMYSEVYNPGTMILMPHVPCPHCSEYQVLKDSQVKLRRINGVEPDHDPVRIRMEKEKAVFYECEKCSAEISEEDRPLMFEKVVWAAPEIEERVNEKYTYYQPAEKIDRDGTIEYNREKMLVPCWNWNRFVDVNFKFYECLARFFESKRTLEKMHIYLNNDMGKFYRPKSEQIATTVLEAKALQSKYYMYGNENYIPDGVLILLLGVDTQDDGFYYVVQGWGQNLESWIIRYGFVECPISLDENQDYNISLGKLINGIYRFPYRLKYNEKVVEMPIDSAFIDRGGHRPGLVDYIVENTREFEAYIGDPRNNPKNQLIMKSSQGEFWIGRSESISEIVGGRLRMDSFHLPYESSDIENDDFIHQITQQYHYKVVTRENKTITKWYKGSRDHFRSCLNMIYAKLIQLDLDKTIGGLFDANKCADLRAVRGSYRLATAPAIVDVNQNVPNTVKQENKIIRQYDSRYTKKKSYFGRGRF